MGEEVPSSEVSSVFCKCSWQESVGTRWETSECRGKTPSSEVSSVFCRSSAEEGVPRSLNSDFEGHLYRNQIFDCIGVIGNSSYGASVRCTFGVCVAHFEFDSCGTVDTNLQTNMSRRIHYMHWRKFGRAYMQHVTHSSSTQGCRNS